MERPPAVKSAGVRTSCPDPGSTQRRWWADVQVAVDKDRLSGPGGRSRGGPRQELRGARVRGPRPGGGQPVQHLIGPHRAMRLQQDLQRAPPHGRQAPALRGHPRFGGVQRMGLALMVIMGREGGPGRRDGMAHVM